MSHNILLLLETGIIITSVRYKLVLEIYIVITFLRLIIRFAAFKIIVLYTAVFSVGRLLYSHVVVFIKIPIMHL